MFQFTSIEQYHAQLKEGQFTCAEVTQQYLRLIHSNKHLNAFIEVFEEEALSRARKLDADLKEGKPCGKLHGVIIGIKDVICYKDHRVSAASRILENFISVYSATAVHRLLEEGAIIIGRLNCDEFAMGSANENSSYGRVLNAADHERVPGGSSGGSAVAVQADLCMFSLGSDTGGSVRQPADFCGIIGFKPTYGRISRHGLVAYASSFDQIGVFGKNIPDIALIYEIIGGPDEFDSTISHNSIENFKSAEAEKKFRFAYFSSAINHEAVDPEISSAIIQFISSLKNDGHVVDAVDFNMMDYVVPAYYILTTAEASSNLSRYDGVRFGMRAENTAEDLTGFYKSNRTMGFGPEVKRRIMLGSFVLSTGYYDAYFTKAQQVRKLLYDQLQVIFSDYDFIILPDSPEIAWKAGEKSKDPTSVYLADIFTVLANLAGLPAVSIPLFKHSSGMPFGLQLLANRFNDLPLLQVSEKVCENI